MAIKYLIDTDILIDLFKGKHSLNEKLKSVGLKSCYVSEISIAELTYGALKSSNKDKQLQNVESVKTHFQTVSISSVIELYSKERLRLEKLGTRIPDFDLLIAVTAVDSEMTLVTGNTKHFQRVENIKIENWRIKNFNEFA